MTTSISHAQEILQDTRPPLRREQFNRLADLIYDLAGIRFQENKAYFLASKINQRVEALGLQDYDDYWNFLNSVSGRTEYGHLMDAVTINETFFFRNQPQLEKLETDILQPMFTKARSDNRNTLRYWSCACSTGDEIYTLALQLLSMDGAQGLNHELVGTDINRDVVAIGRKANYRPYAVRNVPPALLQRYFAEDKVAQTFQLSDDVKKMVNLMEMNLLDGNRIKSMGKFDIIICRNVLIYFDDESKDKVMQNLYDVLNDDGVLILGHADDIYNQRHLFKLDRERSAVLAYQKQPPGTPKLNV